MTTMTTNTLAGLSPTAKLIYFWFIHQRNPDSSIRGLVNALSVAEATAQTARNELFERGLLVGETSLGSNWKVKAADPQSSADLQLPEILHDEDVVVKAVWMWAYPQVTLDMGVRTIAETLHFSQAATHKALKRLQALGLLELTRPSRGRLSATYYVVPTAENLRGVTKYTETLEASCQRAIDKLLTAMQLQRGKSSLQREQAMEAAMADIAKEFREVLETN